KAETAPRVGEDEYVFVYDLRRSVKIVRGEHQSLGKLDMAGDFTPEKPFINEKRHEQRSDEPDYVVINAPAQKGVYEFRSDLLSHRLIPGDIDDNGNFIPELGCRIIDFKDYRYSPTAHTIYNLPVKFL